MATGPLALLGDAIASGTGDWAALERARVERQFVTDRDKAQRDFQVQQQKTAQQYEEKLYKERFLDSVKLDLVKKGFTPESLNTPEGFANAVAVQGPDYLRKIQELQSFRDRILSGEIRTPGIEVVLEMGVDRIDEAREIMASAVGKLADLSETERLNTQRGRGVVAGMVQQSSAEIAALSRERTALTAELARISSGQFTPQEAEEVRQLTMAEAAKSGVTAKDFASPKNAEAVAAARQKAIQQFAMVKEFGIQRALQENTRRYSEANEALGIASRLNPAIAGAMPAGTAAPAALSAGGGAAASATPQPAVASANDAAAFLGIENPKAGDQSQAGGTARSAPSPAQAGATGSYGGIIGALSGAVPMLKSAAGLVGDVVRYAPETAAMIMGGEKAANEVAADIEKVTSSIRRGGVVPSRTPAPIPPALRAGPLNSIADAAQREWEDKVLLRMPYSLDADLIRQRRGMPRLLPQDAAVFGTNTIPPATVTPRPMITPTTPVPPLSR